jgi:hypothetical protein
MKWVIMLTIFSLSHRVSTQCSSLGGDRVSPVAMGLTSIRIASSLSGVRVTNASSDASLAPVPLSSVEIPGPARSKLQLPASLVSALMRDEFVVSACWCLCGCSVRF